VCPVKCILDDLANELCRELGLQVSFHCDEVSDRQLIVWRGCVMMLNSLNLEEMRYIATYLATKILGPRL
jgi:hypothetical protein